MPQSRGPEKKRENGEKSGQPEHRAVNSQLAKGPGNIWFSRHLNGRENITGSKTGGGASAIRMHYLIEIELLPGIRAGTD